MADYSDDLVFDDIPSAIKAFGKSPWRNPSTPKSPTNTYFSQELATSYSYSTALTARTKATLSSLPQHSLPQKLPS